MLVKTGLKMFCLLGTNYVSIKVRPFFSQLTGFEDSVISFLQLISLLTLFSRRGALCQARLDRWQPVKLLLGPGPSTSIYPLMVGDAHPCPRIKSRWVFKRKLTRPQANAELGCSRKDVCLGFKSQVRVSRPFSRWLEAPGTKNVSPHRVQDVTGAPGLPA